MDKKSFTKLTAEVFSYFNTAKMPSASQVDAWYSEVSYVSEFAIPEIKKQIYRTYDSCPRNLPKAIKDAYGNQPTTNRPIVYDPVEDTRYPVQQMHKAFGILESKGHAEFQRFCENTQMPRNDRDRVLYKYRIIQSGSTPEAMVKNLAKSIEYQDEVPF